MSTPAPYSAGQFATDLLSVGNGALLYVTGGVAAGAVILAVTFGIRKGLGALRSVGK
jgi:hypothetical protein